MALDPSELWQEFLSDSVRAFHDIEQSLLALESDPQKPDEINRLYRGLHTLKGNSGFLGLGQVERLAHVTEDLVGLVRDRGVLLDPELCEVLLVAHDRLRAVVEEASNRQRDVDAERVDDVVLEVERARAARVSGEPEPRSDLGGESVVLFADGLADVPVEILVPALDAGYLEVFLSIAQGKMGMMSAAIGALGDPESGAQASVIAESAIELGEVVERMGLSLVEMALSEIEKTARAGAIDLVIIKRLERELHDELVKVETIYQDISGQRSTFGFLAIARLLAADQLFQSLARLRTLVDAFARGQADEAKEIPVLLRVIRTACEHYGFHSASDACLDHEDRYSRAVDANTPLEPSLARRTRELVESVGAAVDAVNRGETCEDVSGLSPGASGVPDASEIARFGLSKELQATLTKDLVARLDGLLAAGNHLYEVRASLDDDPGAEALQSWLTGPESTYITSATVYVDLRTEFDFLVASRLDSSTVAARIAAIDPSGAHVRLRPAGSDGSRAANLASGPSRASVEALRGVTSGPHTPPVPPKLRALQSSRRHE